MPNPNEREQLKSHITHLPVPGQPDMLLGNVGINPLVLDLIADAWLADRERAVEAALLATGMFERCDYCNDVKHGGKMRHTFGEDAKPNGHICDDCAARLTTPKGEQDAPVSQNEALDQPIDNRPMS